MPASKNIAVRQAEPDDMRAVATIYLAAFEESVRDLGLERMQPAAVADIMDISRVAEPAGFFIAELGNEAAGYAISSSDVSRIRRIGLPRLPALLWRWVTGRYDVALSSAIRLVREKLLFWRHAKLPGTDCPARLLSLAVHPRAQGHGLGGALFSAALDHLRDVGVPRVRLEVRPDNDVARHIYEKAGFHSVGQVHDTRGPWDVMILHLEANSD